MVEAKVGINIYWEAKSAAIDEIVYDIKNKKSMNVE